MDIGHDANDADKINHWKCLTIDSSVPLTVSYTTIISEQKPKAYFVVEYLL
jgi:hypothetical protein